MLTNTKTPQLIPHEARVRIVRRRQLRLLNREINIKTSDPDSFVKGLRQRDPLIMEVLSDHIILKGIDPFCNLLWSHCAA